jgi:hypothetical protein
MSRRRPAAQARTIPTAIAIGLGLTVVLAGCTGGDTPSPSTSATSTRSASPTPTATRTAAPTTAPSSTATAAPAPAPSTPAAQPTDDPGDGSGTGTGNGGGADAPATIDWANVTKQGVAAAGGGTVVSLIGSGDSWTVLVAGPDGAQTQSVVSASLGRVTSGPFPKDADAATAAVNAARAKSLQVDAAAAATKAIAAVPGSALGSLVLGGPGTAPVWTASVSVSGATTTVTVDGLSGATRAS